MLVKIGDTPKPFRTDSSYRNNIMEVFSLVWDFLFGTFIRMNNYLESWYENAAEAGFTVSKGSMATTLIWVLLLCGSAMTAMTFAELKNRNRWLHAALGFFLPVIYPVILFFGISKLGVDGKKEEEEQALIEDDVPDSDLKAYADGHGDQTGTLPASGKMDQNFFAGISTDENGNPCGPFVIELDDGQMLEIECITEALPQAVAIQIGEGDTGKTIRLPYDRIKDCKSRERWLDESEAQAELEMEAEENTMPKAEEGE